MNDVVSRFTARSLSIATLRTGMRLGVCATLLASACALTGVSAAPPSGGQKAYTRETDAARKILAKMTLDEKIGQMMQVEQAALQTPDDIVNYHLGSLLSGGGSGPKNPADYNLKGWTALVENYQKIAVTSRLAIPLLYGIDAVHGNSNIPGAVIYPHNIGLGATRDPALVRRIAQATAEEVRAMGANWAFAPCVTVPQDIRWGRTYEGYGQDPALVAALGQAAVEGLQGKRLSDPNTVLASAKHFIGDGGTTYGTSDKNEIHALDQGDTRVDEATLERVHLKGYITTVGAGVGSIMPSYNRWNGIRCSASKELLTNLLKQKLGFEGIAISDYNAIDEIGPDYKDDIRQSVNAGMDMFMMTERYRTFFQDMKELVEEKQVPMSRIDDAVLRILRVKIEAGLFANNHDLMGNAEYQASFGSPAHRAIARQAVRESMVLLTNRDKTLPLSKRATHIVVAGRGADSLGMQCGGWTTTWQGKYDNTVPGGTSILSAIKGAVSKDTVVTYSRDGSATDGATMGVVVIGETPYAEFEGDRADLSIAREDAETVANLKKAHIPVVVVLFSGRPLILGDLVDQADAIVAAWLPGSEGEGVADVLFGDYKPTGKLSFAWPRSMTQLPLAFDDLKADPQFPYGFGLTYGK